MIFIPSELEKILRETPALERAYLVGGGVRDVLLGRPLGRDFDLEVFGLDYEALRQALGRWGRTDLVGRSFGVVKLTTGSGLTCDFTVPRRDSKVAAGHKGFHIEFDPTITPRQAAARRDFTINSLMYDPRSGEVLDFFGGQADLKEKVLRHVGAAFAEDPLRVWRGMQFAGRFDLRVAPATAALARQIKNTHSELAVERVREEWFKWAQAGGHPSAGLRFLVETEWIDHCPEIKALTGTPQEPEWHPEGDVFIHTCHVCDALARLPAWQEADEVSRRVYMMAALAHDFGKPGTTQIVLKEGRRRIVSPGHDETGAELAKVFLGRLRAPGAVVERVVPLVQNHLFQLTNVTDRAVRRLAKRLAPESIEGLCLIMTADSMGRPPRPAVEPENVKALLARSRELNVRTGPPAAILMGRHLIEAGLPPGKGFAAVLRQAYEAQLEGAFGDLPGALAWLGRRAEFEFPEEVKIQLAERAKGGSLGKIDDG
jgi:tRNA nucleotidyltransferase (CCA-adding enzyme)